MMYNSKLAVAIKSNGKILREFQDEVYIPFGSEYSVFIKNLNTVRALVKVEIDGKDVGNGTQLVVAPNSSLDLERYITNKAKGNKFKFIERTAAVEKHRGIKVEDGIVRVEFRFEQKQQTYTVWSTTDSYIPPLGPQHIYRSFTNDTSYSVNASVTSTVNLSDVGITVPGSVSDQQFVDSDWFPTETTSHVIVLKLLGETRGNKQVREPITVNTKANCETCGRKNKATAKFCTECGTALQIF